MSVPTNLIPTKVTGLPEYLGSSTLGYLPYIIDGRTYKVQFANIAAVGAVPSTREINTGSGLGGGGDLSTDRTLYILPGGVDDSRLSVTGVAAGTYGAADSVPVFTVNAQGRVTGVSNTPIVLSNYVPTSRTITTGAGLSGGGDLSINRTLSVNFSSVSPEPLGPGSPGVSTVAAREDHVHPAVDLSDTTETQGVLPLSRGGTGNSLSPVVGAIAYSGSDKMYLTPTSGDAGQVLMSAGGVAPPFWQTLTGTGTVSSVAVATANGFAGTVVNPSTAPVITLSTTVTGLLKGNGTGVSAATAGVDYVGAGPYTTSGLTMASARLLGRTTASIGAAQEITVGTGLTLSGGSLTNAAPDQVVSLIGGTAISVTGAYPSFTVTNIAPDQTVSLAAGTAISVTGTYPSFSVANTAPDQVVSLVGAGTTTVTGTYPSFTITSNDSTLGTVTSVSASGGTTGLTFSGSPITASGTLTLSGTLAVANGGTGATTTSVARANLGATTIGANVFTLANPSAITFPRFNADNTVSALDAATFRAAIGATTGTVTSVSGTGTVSGLSLSGTVTSSGSLTLGGTLAVLPSNFASQTANTVLAAPNGTAGVPTFRAIVAADVPTLNQNTTGTASNVTGIVAVANGGTGASVAATARTNLSAAASGANTDITSITLTTGTISTTPTGGTDIVNKAYADSIASGINFHQSVRLATTTTLPAYTYNNGTSGVGATLTANANGALSIDGVAVVATNRVLIKNEIGAAEAYNGIYTVTQVGNGSTPYILTRATDFDSAGSGVDQIDAGDFFLVTAGSTQANTSWVQQTPLPIVIGTTALVFTQFAAPVLYSAGTGLTLTGTVFSITNSGVTASTYGSASSVPVLAINAQGQVTSASSSSIAIAASQITSGALAIANGGTGATSAATALTNLGAYPASNPNGYTSNTGTVTGVTGTAPIVSSGGTAPAISITAATTGAAGSMSSADKTKLDGIAANANNYVLPKATATALGGVEVFDVTVQTVAANTVTTTAARTYGVQLNAADQMVVNVPWVDTNSGGTVTSVGGTGTVSGLSLSGTVTTTGNLTLGGTLAVTASNFASQTANTFLAAPNGVAGVPTFRAIAAADVPTLNQNTTGTASNVTGTVAVLNGGTGSTTAGGARTNLGATTVGSNFFTLTNPTAITFPRINADNTVSTLDAATFRTAIGAGTSSTTGTVTSVGGTGTVSGLTLSGTVTTTGNLTLGGTLAVTPSNFASQTANTFLAAPNGTAGVPTFRAVVAADIPTLNQNTTGTAANVTGTVAIANGGTGSTTAANALTALGAYPATNPNGYISANQTITLSGDVTGSGTTAITTTLANSGVTAGTYNSVTVNAKGIVTGGTAKEIPNVQSVTSSATVTPNADTNDLVSINAQAVALTLAAPTGTSTDGEKLIIRIKDNGTTQTINWNGVYAAGGATLPTATVAGKWHHVGLIYNVNTTTWLCVAATVQA